MVGASSKAERSPTNVYIPHDGLVWYYFNINNKEYDHHNLTKATTLPMGIYEALQLLLNTEEMLSTDLGCDTMMMTKFKESIGRLFRDLLPSSSEIRSQLKSLQVFRSNLMHCSKEVEKADSDNNENNYSHQERAHEEMDFVSKGLYRLLLELAVSHDTPLSMRKSIISCLDAIKIGFLTKSQDLAHIPEQINCNVIESVLSNPEGCWKKSLQTFFEICNLPCMRPSLVSREITDPTTHKRKNYILDALLIFTQKGAQISTILQQYNEGLNSGSTLMVASQEVLETIEQGLLISSTLKLLFPMIEKQVQNQTLDSNNPVNHTLIIEGLAQIDKSILYPILSSRASNGDVLSATGAALSQSLVLQWTYSVRNSSAISNDPWNNRLAYNAVEKVRMTTLTLPPLHALALIRGLSSSIPHSVLFTSTPSPYDQKNDYLDESSHTQVKHQIILINPLTNYLLEKAQTASEGPIRLSAMKGLETIVSRLHKLIIGTSFPTSVPFLILKEASEHILKEILKVVFFAWESPPSRSIIGTAADLFANVVKILHSIKDLCNRPLNAEIEGGARKSFNPSVTFDMDLEHLVKTVLAQPDNRKGKYVALDILLPLIGAKKLIQMGSDSSNDIITEFMKGIGGDECGGNKNSGVIGDVLGKLLSQLRIEMTETNTVRKQTKVENKRDRRRKERLARKSAHQGILIRNIEETEIPTQLPSDWYKVWVNPLASLLLFSSPHRRNQTAAFFLPFLSFIAGSRNEAPHAFCELLTEVDELWKSSISGERVNLEHLEANNLWTRLELAKHASSQKLIKSSVALKKALSKSIPISFLKAALMHSNSAIRLVGFSAIFAVAASHFSSGDSLVVVENEVKLWIQTLPYACKCCEKEYIFKILQCLTSLFHRIAAAEDDVSCFKGTDAPRPKSLLQSFVCDFLIMDLTFKQGSYPGTVLEKSQFILALLRCILTFISESQTNLMPIKTTKQKVGGEKTKKQVSKRRLSDFHQKVNIQVVRVLLSNEIFSALISLQHSMWDLTRSTALTLSRDILHLGFHLLGNKISPVTFPHFLTCKNARNSLYARAIHLASSPRQRESDTGARILALLYGSCFPEDRGRFLSDLLFLVVKRLDVMQDCLGIVLSRDDISKSTPTPKLQDESNERYNLPLAHGVLQALRLCVEFAKSDSFPVILHDIQLEKQPDKAIDLIQLYDQIVTVCCRSIEVSLAVVADLKQNNEFDGDETEDDYAISSDSNLPDTRKKNFEEQEHAVSSSKSSTPLNVNTGAIGANAVFASLKTMSEDEVVRRTRVQRVIIGSWLLTKEACAALASTIDTSPVPISFESISSSGTLLLQTLSSLKHQGAAFAAHKALEQLSTACVELRPATSHNPRSLGFPSKWANDLLNEISAKETVRDSTLRRSTGIALGFLSIMRSEKPTNVAPRRICPYVLSNIIRLSLPAESEIKIKLESFGLDSFENVFVFPEFLNQSSISKNVYVSDTEYQARSRVHALNVLRMCILDAPLATEMKKFVGDAIASSLLAYNDESWAVRNSGTMVFSAAMLRAIDADKNASWKAAKSNQNSKPVLGFANAVTARELFRCYPHLAPFLVAVLKESMDSNNTTSIHPSLYPILLLISRLQPASCTGADDGTYDIVSPFVIPVLRCLGHKQHKIRIMAARALAKLCTGDNNQVSLISSRTSLLMHCEKMISHSKKRNSNWNECHGALLGLQLLLQGFSKLPSSSVGALLLNFGSWSKQSSGPPSCSTVALQILDDARRSGKSIAHMENSSLEQLAWSTLRMVESADQSSFTIGLATLSQTVSAICCDFSFQAIFDSNTVDEGIRNKHINSILFLFQSPCYDVRLAAIKAFKKPLRKQIYVIIGMPDVDVAYFSKIIYQVSQMVIKAILGEWNRSSSEVASANLDALGYHTPSLRRLTRCLIECLTAYQKIKGVAIFPTTDSTSFEKMWRILVDLREIAGNDDIGNSLGGNAIELMAFSISFAMDQCKNQLNQNLFQQVEVFSNAVISSTDPLNLWEVRHSSAVAICTSDILNWSNVKINDENIGLTLDILENKRYELYLQVLNLLQDNDVDVRIAAGQALNEIKAFSHKQSYQYVSTLTPTPLSCLETTYSQLGNYFGEKNLCERLMKQLLYQGRNLKVNLEFILDEFSNSEIVMHDGIKSFIDILNLNTKRRIFENEDPNPFEENLVITQLTASTLVNSIGNIFRSKIITNEIHHRGKFALTILRERKSNDIAHELSWFGNVFCSMYATFAACICAIYLGCDSVQDIAKSSKEICDKLLQDKSYCSIHPCILDLLRVLSNAQPNDIATQQGLLRCCFLLPIHEHVSE